MNGVEMRKAPRRFSLFCCVFEINSSEWKGMWYTVKECVDLLGKRRQEMDCYETGRI